VNVRPSQAPLGVLFSGGLDSATLVAHLIEAGRVVQPIYIAGGVFWEREELTAAQAFLAAIAGRQLRPLVVLDLPLADLYGRHWSITGAEVPDRETSDEAVYLPGRNPLLILKARLWCQLNGIAELALGSLASNSFADASEAFFAEFEAALDRAMSGSVRLTRPLAQLSKQEVLTLGRRYPLELTFSCLAPRQGRHCGECNKCAERARAFEQRQITDPTRYASREVSATRSD
jgi:7-cyano-7-deazaguanine synthase